MPRPRHTLVSLASTPFYHCVARCVRRAFLCGFDKHTNKDFSHRRQWIVDRISFLSQVFAMDVCAYAIMSNHYHVVVRVGADKAKAWTDDEIIRRWELMFGLPLLVERFKANADQTAAELDKVREILETWRERLMDLSWFMRCLNESIARLANAEDGCTGRFWEGRFKSQALLDEAALLTCMSYVDLNPIRAQLADTPEASEFTSIKSRIDQWHTEQGTTNAKHAEELQTGPALLPLIGNERADQPDGIAFAHNDYIELVDWSGRMVRENKRGAIPKHEPPILQRLGINPERFIAYLKHEEAGFADSMGNVKALRESAAALGRKFLHGVSAAKRLFENPAPLQPG